MRALSRLLRCIPALVLSTIAVPVMAQVPTSVSIPETLYGSYVLEITDATLSSPLQNTDPLKSTDDVILYLSPLGELCLKSPNTGVEVISSQPKLQYGLFSKVSWSVDGLDMRFTLDISKSSFAGIDVSSLDGTQFGRLTGTRVDSNNPDTGSCRSSTFDSRDALRIIEAAETAYPSYFPASALSVNQIGDGFDLYRYYPTSKVYLAIKGNYAFARGGEFGSEYIVIGYVDELITSISNLRVPSSDSRIAFFQGTYLLELSDALPVSPIPDGTQINLVVGGGGLLCIGEKVLAFPSITGINATWSDPISKLRYVLDLSRSGDNTNFGVGEFELQSTSGIPYGLFSGDQTSLSKECSGAQGVDPDLASKNAFFSLIETEYPALFPSGPQTFNQTQDGFTYRYYFGPRIFVGIKDKIVYANGGQFGFNNNPLPIGTLSALSAQINNALIANNFPVISAGTYSMSFSSASVLSPFTNGTTATVAFDANGALCLNGTNFGIAATKNASPNVSYWENSDLGLKFSVDTASISGSSISLSVASTAGQAYSTLSGTRASFETGCGTTSEALSIAKANQLFGLAEQYYPQYFPNNILSVNQLSGNTVQRFYQSTGIFLAITGQEVSVRGGPFGGSYVGVGSIDALISQIVLENTPAPPPIPAAPIYDLKITGTGQVIVLSTFIPQTVDIKKNGVELPDSSNSSMLIEFVRTSFAGTLPRIDTVAISSVVSTATQLVFNATVTNSTTIGSTTTNRKYDLVYTFSKR